MSSQVTSQFASDMFTVEMPSRIVICHNMNGVSKKLKLSMYFIPLLDKSEKVIQQFICNKLGNTIKHYH